MNTTDEMIVELVVGCYLNGFSQWICFANQLKLTFPIASKPLSNNKTMPKNIKAKPMHVRPRPIWVFVLISNIFTSWSLLLY